MKEIIDCFDGEYRFLSNFDMTPVHFDGIDCRTSESAFQMMKTTDLTLRKKIGMSHPSEAKRLGRHLVLREDWEDIKDRIMLELITAKFIQHPELAQKLLDTKEAELIEGNNWNDTYWGVCNGIGKNQLGKTLMYVRDLLRKEHSND